MKNILKKVLPKSIVEFVQLQRNMAEWKKRDYLENSPQLVKEKVLLKTASKMLDGWRQVLIQALRQSI